LKSFCSALERFCVARLQEIGDVENWAHAIEKDMTEVVDTLELINAEKPGPG